MDDAAVDGHIQGGTQKTYEPTVNADGTARTDLSGDLNPTHLTLEYDGMTLFDKGIEASDGPCKPTECPKD